MLAGIAASLAGAEPPTPAAERWYHVLIDGQPAGSMVEREKVEGDHITSESSMELEISRGGTTIKLAAESGFVETRAGEALEMWSRQQMGEIPVVLKARFLADGIELATAQGGATTKQRLPRPAGAWLAPAAADRVLREKLAAGARVVSLRTIDPEVGAEAIELTYTRLGEAVDLELPQGTVSATPWREEVTVGPDIESTVYLDADGKVLKSETSIMGLTMTLLRTSRERALGKRPPPEILAQTLVRPVRPIPAPRRQTRMVYRVTSRGSEVPALPATGSQVVARGERGDLRVTVSTKARQSSPLPDRERYLRASSYLNITDPKIVQLAQQALKGVPDDLGARAEALRAFVHHYLVRKDLSTGFATATEVAQSKSGDCTEHAVLLAALLRAAGIPSRAVSGLLYVEEFAGAREVFGYHMWTQSWIDGVWVDLDAMTENAFDATHIALGLSTLNDDEGMVGSSLDSASTLAALEVEVVEIGEAQVDPPRSRKGER